MIGSDGNRSDKTIMRSCGIKHDQDRESRYSSEADEDDKAGPVKRPTVEISALWIRRVGGESGVGAGVELLVEINGLWYIVMDEPPDANFSRIAESGSADKWQLSPFNEGAK